MSPSHRSAVPGLLLAALLASCAAPAPGPGGRPLPAVWAVGPDRLLELDPSVKTPIDSLPMYGGMDRSQMPELQRADEKLIADTSDAYGSREAASAEFAQRGLEHYDRDEYGVAMRRLNQAWLLDDSNPDVYYGFASVYQDHKNYKDAGRFAKTSLTLGQDHPLRVADCAYILAKKRTMGPAPADGELGALKERLKAELSPIIAWAMGTVTPLDRPYVQGMAFKTQMLICDYDSAWRSFDALESMGEAVPESYRKVLVQQPRPGR